MLGRGVNVGQILRFGQVSLQVVRAFPSGSNLVERVTVWEWINNETKDVEVTDHRRGVKKTTSSQNFMLDLCPLIDKIHERQRDSYPMGSMLLFRDSQELSTLMSTLADTFSFKVSFFDVSEMLYHHRHRENQLIAALTADLNNIVSDATKSKYPVILVFAFVDCLTLDTSDAFSTRLLSLLSSLVDQRSEHFFVICTCSSLETVPMSLCVPHKLGMPLRLFRSVKETRKKVVRGFVRRHRISICKEDGMFGDIREDSKENFNDIQGSQFIDLFAEKTNGLFKQDLEAAIMNGIVSGRRRVGPSQCFNLSCDAVQLFRQTDVGRGKASSHLPRNVEYNSSNVPTDLVGVEAKLNYLFEITANAVIRSNGRESSAPNRVESGPCTGVLISGPSGCGKSALVHELIKRAAPRFNSIEVTCADLIHKVVGESERQITTLFRRARQNAPCFIILEGLESLLGQQGEVGNGEKANGMYRSSRTSHSALDRVLSALLIEMDGIQEVDSTDIETGSSVHVNASRVVVVATTQSPDSIDRALKRPGRLEEHISLELPNLEQRKQILSRSVSREGGLVNGVCVETLAKKTEGRSHAEVYEIAQDELMKSVRERILT
jgi:hypothetical protein